MWGKGLYLKLTARWGPAQNVFQYCVTEQKEKKKKINNYLIQANHPGLLGWQRGKVNLEIPSPLEVLHHKQGDVQPLGACGGVLGSSDRL